ncbi:MAG: BppU family phage baseplate upper protein [Lachnospiraceae bacterium]|nr:BppU family phage baseplate upper protein [Lachnospiraceae bacterium]
MIIYKLNTIPRYDSAKTVVHANEGEFGGQWVFDIMDGDSPFDLTYGIPEVTINILKADKNVYSNPVARGMDENGRVIVDIKEQMTAAPGKAIAELVFERTGMKKATANFIIDVERSPVNMGGHESESLISYVERNREAAENATARANAAAASADSAVAAAANATASAQAAQRAAENAQNVANTAVDNVTNAVQNIEGMPQMLQALASSLASTGIPQRFLGFDGSGNAAAYDTGFVTPEMFGAKADGTTDDKAAFEAALASGHKVVVPPASYKLSAPIWSDDSIVIDNSGTYAVRPLIVSKELRSSAPIERMVKQFNASTGNTRDYSLRGACYDSTNDRIVAAYGTTYESVEDLGDIVLTAYDTDFNPVSGMSKVISGVGSGAGLCYNAKTHKIYAACGDGHNQIARIDPETLTFEAFVTLPVHLNVRSILYDEERDIYYVNCYSEDGDICIVHDSAFAELDKHFLSVGDDIAELVGDTGTLYVEQGAVIDGQMLQLLTGSSGAYIVQHDYSSYNILKKAYRIPSHYHGGDEPKALVDVGGTIYMLTDIAGTDGQRCVSVSRLVIDERVDGNQGIYDDTKILGSTSLTDLNDVLTVGCYLAPSVSVASALTNAPTTQAFVMWVLPVPIVKESRAQIVLTYHGDIFVRTYVAHVGIWYGWRQLAEGPRKNANQSFTWDGSGYVTSGGTEIRFTIPHAMPTEAAALPTVTVTALRVNARQGGNYILSSGTDVATASGYTITATATPVGINIAISKTAAFPDVVNNECCGIGATVTMHFA